VEWNGNQASKKGPSYNIKKKTSCKKSKKGPYIKKGRNKERLKNKKGPPQKKTPCCPAAVLPELCFQI